MSYACFFASIGIAVAAFAATAEAKYEQWQHSQYIILNTTSEGADIPENVLNFPLLIRLDESNFHFDQAREKGQDIRFTDPQGNPLPYEIECWDKANKTAEIWVKLPIVPGDSASWGLAMFWGNPAAKDQSNYRKVFERQEGFVIVLHMNRECNQARFSPPSEAGCYGAQQIERTVQWFVNAIPRDGRPLTAALSRLFSSLNLCGLTPNQWPDCRSIASEFTISWWGYDSTAGWRFFAYVFSHGTCRYYQNGNEIPRTLVHYQMKSQRVDEVRFENVARQSEWIRLCWENKRDNQILVAFQDLVITAQPQSKTVNEGQLCVFAVSAHASPVIHYQWYKEFDRIEGAILPTLTISTAQIQDQGAYYCLVSNSGDSLRSDPASLEIIETDTTAATPLEDSDGDGVPDAVEDQLGSDKYDPLSLPADLAYINNWNNNSAINSRRTYDFSAISGYIGKDSIPLLIPAGALKTDYTVLLQMLQDISGVPEPEFKPGYVRHGRYLKVTTTLSQGRSTLVPIPFPRYGFVPLDFMQVKRWNGTAWEELKIVNITSDAIYVQLLHSSAEILSVGKDTKAVLFAGDWSTITSPSHPDRVDPTLVFSGDGVSDALYAANARNIDADPLNDIQEIWVTKGTYALAGNGKSSSFVLVPNVFLFGGFPQSGSFQKAGCDPAANPTVLLGVSYPGPIQVWNVVRGASDAGIDGFTIQSGLADDESVPSDLRRYNGAGMYNENVRNLVVRNCSFTNNMAAGDPSFPPESNGGAIFCLNSAVTIERCLFKANIAYDNGGGVYISGTFSGEPPCKITRSDFVENSADTRGAGVYNSGSNTELTRCTFIKNGYAAVGGALFTTTGNPSVQHCTFAGNHAEFYGGGIAASETGAASASKCILWDQWIWYTPNMPYAEISGEGPTQPGITVSYSDVKRSAGTFPGTANINANPLFRVSQPTSPLDVRLQYSPIASPCINNPGMLTDNAYPGSKPDMGAFEHALLMPLGNSITYGYGFTPSYRQRLWNLLHVEFVGTDSDGSKTYDGNYQAATGRSCTEIQDAFESSGIAPDIVLVIAGTNNLFDLKPGYQIADFGYDIQNYIASALGELNSLLGVLKAGAWKVFVGSIPLFTYGSFTEGASPAVPGFQKYHPVDNAYSYSYNYSTVVSGITAGGIRSMSIVDGQSVIFADLAGALSGQTQTANASLMRPNDGVHPNSLGYRAIADTWYECLSQQFPWAR